MPYYHTCRNCSKIFWGRRNQIFHDETCKAEFNNRKAAEIRAELLDTNVMQKSHLILKVFYKIYSDKEPVDFEDLLSAGLDPSAPVRIIQTPINAYEYQVIHGFGYRFTDKTKKKVIINTKNELNNL
jgi:hypothetical protein